MCGLKLHRQGPETARARTFEGGASVEQVAVQVETDVRLQALGKSF